MPLGDTIFAVSSGSPPAAITIIRVSGPAATEVAAGFRFSLPEPRRAALRTLHDEHGGVLDRSVVLFFPAGGSATGEPLVELQVHGGRALVRSVLSRLEAFDGFRLAQAGEFTRRAVANGRMDLLEAEALGDLLAAETEDQRRRATTGATLIRAAVDEWEAVLLRVAADIEISLDHDEEHGPHRELDLVLAQLLDKIDSWLARPSSERLRDGFRVLIAGPPNAGKSTLLNAIAGRPIAITSDIPGTTRDMVEVPMAISGIAVRLSDTPGLRPQTDDPIERIGIERAREALACADLVLWLDPSDPHPESGVIRVAAKADAVVPFEGADAVVSATTGAGLNDLVRLIGARLRPFLLLESEAALNSRQWDAVEKSGRWVRGAAECRDLVLKAEHIREARAALGKLTGRGGLEALLDEVFTNFCLGK